MGYMKSDEVLMAYEALHDAYQKEKAQRAKVAWQNGIKWVVYMLQDGATLDQVIRKAEDYEVEF